jgi:Virulence-associated protein E-like domain
MDLPQALKPYGREKRWVVWKYEGDERPTKVLYQPTNHEHRARNNDQSHWSNAETAIGVAGAFEFDGIGLCLMDSELAAFDIDDCRDPRTGAIDPWVEALVRDCNSYTEVTPRGKGLRIIGYSDGVLSKGRKLPAPSEGVSIECYEEACPGRYITVTSRKLDSAPDTLSDITQVIQRVIRECEEVKRQRRQARPQRSGTNGSGGGSAQQTHRGDVPHQLKVLLEVADHGSGREHAGYRSRSELLFTFICGCIRAGVSPEMIKAACLDNARIGCAIYEHCQEQNRSDYVEAQIEQARSTISQSGDDFQRNEANRIIRSQANVATALRLLGVGLSYDVFSDRMLISGLDDHELLNDAAVLRLWFLIQERFKFQPAKEFFFDSIFELARAKRFHPVIDYLNGLTWDKEPRLGGWLVSYANAFNTPYVRAVGRLLLIAAVRRVRHPGCKFDEMVVLEGPQGTTPSPHAIRHRGVGRVQISK